MITLMTIPAMTGTVKEKTICTFWTLVIDSAYMIPLIWDFIK